MPARLPLLLVTCVLSLLAYRAQAEAPPSQLSYVTQLLRYDRNGDGRLDAAEREAMRPKPPEEEQPLAGLPLICEREATGSGGGSASSAATQEQWLEANEQFGPRLQLVARHHQVPAQEPRELEVDQAEAAADQTEGYQPPPPSPQPPQQPAGFNQAVLYRMLKNNQQRQPAAKQVRRAAVFGATIGLTKQQPGPYARSTSCCGPSRATITAYFIAGR